MPYTPWTRQVTGRPHQSYAYVLDDRGRVVATCSHRHVRRGGKNGGSHAMRCAEQMVRFLIEGRSLPDWVRLVTPRTWMPAVGERVSFVSSGQNLVGEVEAIDGEGMSARITIVSDSGETKRVLRPAVARLPIRSVGGVTLEGQQRKKR